MRLPPKMPNETESLEKEELKHENNVLKTQVQVRKKGNECCASFHITDS